MFCGPYRNSPKLVGDTSRRHSSIPRGSSTDKGVPLAAQDNTNVLSLPEDPYSVPDKRYGNELVADDALSNGYSPETTSPMLGHRDSDKYEVKSPTPFFQFLGPRRRVRETNSLDVIPNNKHVERLNANMKTSCQSLQVSGRRMYGRYFSPLLIEFRARKQTEMISLYLFPLLYAAI